MGWARLISSPSLLVIQQIDVLDLEHACMILAASVRDSFLVLSPYGFSVIRKLNFQAGDKNRSNTKFLL